MDNMNATVLGRDKLDAYIDRIKSLPPTPSVMLKLLALFKEPSPDTEEVVSLSRRDPALTLEVLKICNSARYRGEENVTDMFEAVTRVGLQEVYRIVMMVSATSTISLNNVDTVLEVEALCRHSKATAVSAEVVAKAIGEQENTAFVAGLLHDIGKIALASAEGVRYRSSAVKNDLQGASLSEWEKKHFGFDHGEVGGRLLERWGFPQEIALAVQYHHNVARAGDPARLASTVAMADWLAHALEKKTATDASSQENLAKAASSLNLATEAVTILMGRVKEELGRDAFALGRAN
jgi:putative nucleotidyltransferase with HDIG domain